MNDGHAVAGIDGLKIEPLPEQLSGVAQDGARVAFEPIRDVARCTSRSTDRVMAGFEAWPIRHHGALGTELPQLVRLPLERRADFAMYGGCASAAGPRWGCGWSLASTRRARHGRRQATVLDIPNGLARGVRAASDFLMALQLTGAAKSDSIRQHAVRLPVVVVGGGLTAIDTATESLAYYLVQIEKFSRALRALAAESGEDAVAPNGRPGAGDRRGSPRARPRGDKGACDRRARGREARGGRASPALGRRHHRQPRRLIDSPSIRSITRK